MSETEQPDEQPHLDLEAETEEEEAPEQQATTTFTKDYLGRLLLTPAVSGKDYLGRAILAGDRDYLNRALI